MCLPLKPGASLFSRLSEMDASSNLSGHMINFFYGFLDNRGGTNCPMALLTPVSPNLKSCEPNRDVTVNDKNIIESSIRVI